MQPLTRLRIAIARSFVAFLALVYVATFLMLNEGNNVGGFVAFIVSALIAACFLLHALTLCAGYSLLKDSVRKATSG